MEQQEVLHIIKRVKNGDKNAFALLVDEYKDMVYSICFKLTRSAEDTEEISQDAFVKAYSSLSKFKGKAKFSTWLYQIAYFTTINFLRKNKIETTTDFEGEISAGAPSVLTEIHAADRKAYINKAMNYLTVEERALITLFHLEEKTIQEIATITALSVSNVKVKLMRTRKKLYGILTVLLKKELHYLL